MLWMIWLLPIVVTPVGAGALVWWRLRRAPEAAPAHELHAASAPARRERARSSGNGPRSPRR